ncbi:LuxR C-terminal-related transcriptional regulator [Pseudarthrobacter sp. YALA5]|uniref:LuxR C-terminal-related transcriptional regulator n=1 Tax=Pseudarthrobacter sp. DSP2-3-2b1 TaxID=2804661 RepID=UPI00103E1849
MALEDLTAKGYEALEAGRWADARAAFEEAVVPIGSADALAGLGDALFFLGDVGESVRCRERAYAVSRRTGRTPEAIDSAVWLCLVYGMSLGNRAAAQGWLARAESMAGPDDTLSRAWIDFCAALLATDVHRSRDLIERALAISHELGDPDLSVCALAERGVVLVKDGEVEAGLRCVDEAMASALAGDGTTFYTVVMAGCSMLTVCDLLSDLLRARQWSQAADDYMQAYGCPYLYAQCRLVHGRVLLLTGNWAEAEEELRRAAAGTRSVFPGMFHRAIASLAELRLRQGNLDEARALIEGIGMPAEASLVAAGLALRNNEPVAAVALAERWLRSETGSTGGTVPPLHAGGERTSLETAGARSLLVEAHLAAGHPAAAAAVAQHLAELDGGAEGVRLLSAHAALASGRVAAAEGRLERATIHFEQALEWFAQLDLPLEAGRTRLELARVLAAGQASLAVSEARAALSLFDKLGASHDADVAAALLRSWGAAGRAVPRVTGPLTRREQEILGLLVQGYSNHEIAVQLYISRKTVAHHVSSVLDKLGLRNRAEAAAYAARLGTRQVGLRT